MKIRTGFVSNSSSSSFVVVMKDSDHEKFVASLTEVQEALMESFTMDTDKFMGEKIVIYSGLLGSYLCEDPESIIGEELAEQLIEETGDDYIDLNEYFHQISFPKDSIYTVKDC